MITKIIGLQDCAGRSGSPRVENLILRHTDQDRTLGTGGPDWPPNVWGTTRLGRVELGAKLSKYRRASHHPFVAGSRHTWGKACAESGTGDVANCSCTVRPSHLVCSPAPSWEPAFVFGNLTRTYLRTSFEDLWRGASVQGAMP